MVKSSMQELIDWLDPSFSSVIDKAKELLEKEKQQSEPLPDSGGMSAEEVLKKNYMKLEGACEEDWISGSKDEMHQCILTSMEDYKKQ